MAGVTKRRIIVCDQIAPPVGPYNHAVIIDNMVYVSGNIGMNKEGQLVDGGITEQAKQTMSNIGAILTTADSDFSKVVKTTVYLANISDYGAFNQVYATYFTANAPARSAFQVGALPKGALVEVEVVAVSGTLQDV